MKNTRRRFLQMAAGTAALPTISRSGRAQAYPSRPVRLIVGFPAGSAPDIMARIIAQSLSGRLGQQMIVDNRPGAAGNLATETVARAAPDGYALLLTTTTNAVNDTLYDNLKFSFVRDVAPIAGVNRAPLVMVVNPSFTARTVPEFIAYAKANPGRVDFGSAGIGSASHVAGELFKMMAGVDMRHIPYRGNYLLDVVGGQVPVAFTPVQASIGHVRTRALIALAVTGATHLDALPGIPALGEFVPGYEATVWTGIGAPKRTAGDAIETLSKQISAVLADPEVRARIADSGAEPMPMTTSEFAKFVAGETEKWGKVIKFANIKPE